MSNRFINDFFRCGLAILAVAALVLVDESNNAVVQAIVIGVAMALASHVTRRILFPDLDLQLIALQAVKTPTGAAIVFAAICAVLISIMQIGLQILT